MTAPHRRSTEGLDRAALEQAMAIVQAHPNRGAELAAVMAERGWHAAAAVAAYDAQCRSLNLAPWELPPCVAGKRGKDRAAKLLRRMLRRGVSRWNPRPLEAIAAAGAAR